MKKKTTGALVLGLAAALGGGAFWTGKALADGAPTTDPLFYTGVLEEDGVLPAVAVRQITVELFDAASAGNSLCATSNATTPVQSGRFRLTLDPACATALRAQSEVWSEVTVAQTTLPRTKIGAVPYALEADHALTADQATSADSATTADTATVADSVTGLTIDGSGRVGVGTTSPSSTLSVEANDGTAAISVTETSGTMAPRPMLTLTNNGPPQIRFENTDTGDVWVFGMSASGGMTFNLVGSGVNQLLVSQAGDATIPGSLTASGSTFP